MSKKKTYATGAQLRGAKRRRYLDVPAPELSENGEEVFVRVRSLTALERGQFQSQFLDDEGNLDPKKVALSAPQLTLECAVDENDNRLFGPDEVDDLGEIDGGIVSRIADAAMRLSRIGKYETLKEMVGNFAGTSDTSGMSGMPPSTAAEPTGSDA